ncbi:MAG: class I SAM-dependent methyltransferase [Gammaproteobacteria bacterium]|nr:class I SAM-dependent methyltransferase [Gammaproteobacteria bacterium]
MLICPHCSARLFDLKDTCTSCGFDPQYIDGFLAWSPTLARKNSGFNSEDFAGLAQIEEQHFWFRARNNLITWALEKYFPEVSSFLEIGCGTGFVLSGIANKFPKTQLVGSEIYTSGLKFAAQRLTNTELVQMDARSLPYLEEFDVVGAFDVIEHIKEDQQVLENIHAAIKPGGGCLITVPQHKWLWSAIDEQACHQRRYSAKELHAKIEKAGFQILRSTSFVSSLLPAMAVARLLNTNDSVDDSSATDGLKINPWLNSIMFQMLQFESALIKMGINLPFGGSRMIVAGKT